MEYQQGSSGSADLEDRLRAMGMTEVPGTASSIVATSPASVQRPQNSKYVLSSAQTRSPIQVDEDGRLEIVSGDRKVILKLKEGSVNSKPYQEQAPMDPATFYQEVVQKYPIQVGAPKVSSKDDLTTTSRKITWNGSQPLLSILSNVKIFGARHIKKCREKKTNGHSRVVFYSNPCKEDAVGSVVLSGAVLSSLADFIAKEATYKGCEVRSFCWEGKGSDGKSSTSYNIDDGELEVSLDSVVLTSTIFPADAKSAQARKNQLFETPPYNIFVEKVDERGNPSRIGVPVTQLFGKSGMVELVGRISTLDLYERSGTKTLSVTFVIDHMIVSEAMLQGNNLATTDNGNSALKELEAAMKDRNFTEEQIRQLAKAIKKDASSPAQHMPQYGQPSFQPNQHGRAAPSHAPQMAQSVPTAPRQNYPPQGMPQQSMPQQGMHQHQPNLMQSSMSHFQMPHPEPVSAIPQQGFGQQSFIPQRDFSGQNPMTASQMFMPPQGYPNQGGAPYGNM